MIVSGYLNKELLKTTTSILGVLFLIFISQRVVRYLGEAVDGDISGSMVFQLLGLYSPVLLGYLIPLALFLGVLLSLSRLYVDNEITVLRGGGVSEWQMARMLTPTIIGFGVFATLLTFWITPWANETQYQLREEQSVQSQLGLLTPGSFQPISEGSGVIYSEDSPSRDRLGRVFFVRSQKNDPSRLSVIVSRSGNKNSSARGSQDYLELNDGYSYDFDPEQLDWSITKFDNYFMRVGESEKKSVRRKIKADSTASLWQRRDAESWAELHWRLTVPLSIPLFCLLAVPLARVEPRQGKFAKLLPALLIYVIYVMLIIVTRNLTEDEKLPGWLGNWWIFLGLGALVAYYFGKHERMHQRASSKRVGRKRSKRGKS